MSFRFKTASPFKSFFMKTSIISLFILLLWVSACQNAGSEDTFPTMDTEQAIKSSPTGESTTDPLNPNDEEQPAPQRQQSQESSTSAGAPVSRQIIKTADLRIQVKDINKSSKQAERTAQKYGGYVSESTLTNSNYEISNSITIRVPAGKFDSLLNNLSGEALFIQHKRISSQDVTEEYVDVTTRLKTKKEVRDRYIDILRNKAKTVEDVLKAEEQIRIIQEEIEAKEGRLRYLKDQVALSTIYLELYQTIEYRPEPSTFYESFWSKVISGLKNGWHVAQDILLFFINIWPLVILGILVWWKRRWIRSKFRRR